MVVKEINEMNKEASKKEMNYCFKYLILFSIS